MKKLLLFLPVLLVCLTGFSQESDGLCNMDYQFVLKETNTRTDSDIYATFQWDFSAISAASPEAKIEIVPIMDCWNKAAGTQTKDPFFYEIKETKGGFDVYHLKMMAKCFKWRLILKAGSCSETSVWNYHSFLD